jgi:hypothetical protein
MLGGIASDLAKVSFKRRFTGLMCHNSPQQPLWPRVLRQKDKDLAWIN